MISFPEKPVFVSPYRDVPGGVDYLGLRAVNLDLMNQFLPGINNVTEEVRPYSVACWIVWAFAEKVTQQGLDEFYLSDFKRFREKAELLFNWSHSLNSDDFGMFGNAQVKPKGTEQVPLSFSDWSRNVSWFDAVAYGPSLKTENGLGFLKQVHPGIFAVTKLGKELAENLDHQLINTNAYEVLAGLGEQFIDETAADSLYSGWRRQHASEGERAVFRRAFYNRDAISSNDSMGRRSAAITLVYATIQEANEGLTEQQVRRKIVVQEPSDLPENTLSDLRASRANWQVLQIRQAHRLAFEVLFGWLEWQVLVNGLKTSGELVKELLQAISSDDSFSNSGTKITDLLAEFEFHSASDARLIEKIDEHDELDFFSHIDQLLAVYKDDQNNAAGIAFRLLLLCSALTENLKQNEHATGFLKQGGALRVSLKFWSTFVASNRNLTLAEFLLIVVENFLLSQHFGFAAARYSEGKLRLRVTIEDTGLVSLLPGGDKVWKPVVTPDRLATALSLMSNSGIISRKIVTGEIQYSI